MECCGVNELIHVYMFTFKIKVFTNRIKTYLQALELKWKCSL